MSGLVLSLFPGMDVLGLGFEREGFCVVQGPDVIFGRDVREFHPPAGVFAGVIGGPPCQCFSPIGNVNRARYGDDCVMPDLIPEFRRIIVEADPVWWVMENNIHAYGPFDDGWEESHMVYLDTAWLGEKQNRRRAFWSNLQLPVGVPALVSPDAGSEHTVTSKGGVDWKGSRAKRTPRTLADDLELQGLPPDFLDEAPYTMQAKRKLVGNAVPLPMAVAIAKAVKEAISQ